MADSAERAETAGPGAHGESRGEPNQGSLSMPGLVHQHYRAVYGYAYRLTGNASDAEDLCQQTFLIAQRKLHQVRDRAKADRWLLSIVRTCFLKSRRRKRPLTGIELAVDEIPDRATESPIDGEQLQAALNALPDEFRVVVTMFYFDCCSYKEIASELGLPIGTVMSRLARAKGRLRQRLLTGSCEGTSAQDLLAALPESERRGRGSGS
jgi:RNA polymerase sigma-70 factor (ECF subfamily)